MSATGINATGMSPTGMSATGSGVGFDAFLATFVFPWETGNDPDGGYTHDPDDPGGETKWGVSKRSYPDVDIRALTREQAVTLYFRDYWLHTGRQKSNANRLPHPLNFAHFDCTVNLGNWKTAKDGTGVWHGRANMILQRALGVEDDSYVGPLTLAAVEHCDPIAAAIAAVDLRDAYYATRGTWAAKYRRGWYNRTAALRKKLGLPARDPGRFEAMVAEFRELEVGA